LQNNSLKRLTQIIVATLGRLIDLVKHKAIYLNNIKTIILDEAYENLSMGFKSELNEILNFISAAESKWLF
jgi:ATP-dependent RNA helicase DeaD